MTKSKSNTKKEIVQLLFTIRRERANWNFVVKRKKKKKKEESVEAIGEERSRSRSDLVPTATNV